MKWIPKFMPLLLAGVLGCNSGSVEQPTETTEADNPADAAFEPSKSSPPPSVTASGEESVAITPPTPTDVVRDKKTKSGEPAPTVAAEKIALKPTSLDEYRALIEENKGKIIAVDCWASWCIPCRQKLPAFVELASKHHGQDAVFMTLSFDVYDDELEQAVEILETENARFLHLQMSDGQTAFEDSHGFEGIPRYLVYDREGKIVVNTSDMDEVKAKVAELAAS